MRDAMPGGRVKGAAERGLKIIPPVEYGRADGQRSMYVRDETQLLLSRFQDEP
jgi:hypothetical protein